MQCLFGLALAVGGTGTRRPDRCGARASRSSVSCMPSVESRRLLAVVAKRTCSSCCCCPASLASRDRMMRTGSPTQLFCTKTRPGPSSSCTGRVCMRSPIILRKLRLSNSRRSRGTVRSISAMGFSDCVRRKSGHGSRRRGQCLFVCRDCRGLSCTQATRFVEDNPGEDPP